eukprot:10264851-Alexandrium_andersonii.AAC.1
MSSASSVPEPRCETETRSVTREACVCFGDRHMDMANHVQSAHVTLQRTLAKSPEAPPSDNRDTCGEHNGYNHGQQTCGT